MKLFLIFFVVMLAVVTVINCNQAGGKLEVGGFHANTDPKHGKMSASAKTSPQKKSGPKGEASIKSV
jgi:hypothetical protein